MGPSLDDIRTKVAQSFARVEKHLRAVGAAARVEASVEGELIASALLKSNVQLVVIAVETLLRELEALRVFAERAAAATPIQSADVEALVRENEAAIDEALSYLTI